MKTFIINLDNEKQRKKYMEAEMKKLHISNFTFFKAINGETELHNYSFKLMNNWKDVFKNRPITMGEIGCAISHWELWKYIINNNIEIALILEDDVIFEESFSETFNKIVDLNMDFDFLYLSRLKLNNTLNLGDEESVNELIAKAKYCFNMHSYIITLNGCKKLTATNFLNMLVPIDEYLPMMYDINYPFKQYSCFFEKYEKIICYGLKINITDQLINNWKSSIDNSNIYNNIMNNDLYKCWDIDLNLETEQKIKIYDYIENFFTFNNQKNIDICNIDLQKQDKSIIEQLVFDIVLFNCKEFDIDIDNIYISVWLRQLDYDLEYSHIHVDHCDYEFNKFGTTNITPLRTAILYIDDSDTPTIITDIDKCDSNNNNFSSSNILVLSFPSMFKLISFKSSNYHGECYLKNSEPTKRRAFVIGIWDKQKKPQFVPSFDISSFILWSTFKKKKFRFFI